MSEAIQPDAAAAPSDTIDLVALAQVLWRRRRVVYLCLGVGLILALIWLHIAPYTYTARMEVVPIQSSSSGGSKLGGLSSLASMAGVSLPQDQSGFQFTLYIEGLHSRAAADALSKNQDLMKVLYPAEWDPATKTWRQPRGAMVTVVKTVKAFIGLPSAPWQPPNGARLQQYLEHAVDVSQDTKKPVVTVTFDHRDPAFAVAFLNALNKAVDGELRKKALFRSSQNIAYLSDQLKTVTLSEQREAIMHALSDQERSAMMANSTAAFAAETFGQPYQSYRPTSPLPAKIFGMALGAGLMIGIGLAFLAPLRWIVRLVPGERAYMDSSAGLSSAADDVYTRSRRPDAVGPTF